MAQCFICPEEATHKLTFEVPGQEPKTVGFCQVCSERVGKYIRWRKRLVGAGLVDRQDPAHAEEA